MEAWFPFGAEQIGLGNLLRALSYGGDAKKEQTERGADSISCQQRKTLIHSIPPRSRQMNVPTIGCRFRTKRFLSNFRQIELPGLRNSYFTGQKAR